MPKSGYRKLPDRKEPMSAEGKIDKLAQRISEIYQTAREKGGYAVGRDLGAVELFQSLITTEASAIRGAEGGSERYAALLEKYQRNPIVLGALEKSSVGGYEPPSMSA